MVAAWQRAYEVVRQRTKSEKQGAGRPLPAPFHNEAHVFLFRAGGSEQTRRLCVEDSGEEEKDGDKGWSGG